jgi:hypothetical protein
LELDRIVAACESDLTTAPRVKTPLKNMLADPTVSWTPDDFMPTR